jgi:hypothetical protein
VNQPQACGAGLALMNHSPLDRFLPNYFVRILVYSDSKKDWLPETIIPRPLGEFNPTDDRWFDLMAAFHFSSNQSLVPAAPASCRAAETRISMSESMDNASCVSISAMTLRLCGSPSLTRQSNFILERARCYLAWSQSETVRCQRSWLPRVIQTSNY